MAFSGRKDYGEHGYMHIEIIIEQYSLHYHEALYNIRPKPTTCTQQVQVKISSTCLSVK